MTHERTEVAMSMFFRKPEDRLREERRNLAETIRGIREGRVEIANIGTRLCPALKVLCPEIGEMRFPPAYFASLTAAVLEGVHDSSTRETAQTSLALADAECALALKARFPALEGLNLGTDDLMLVACEGRLMAEEARQKLAAIAHETPGMALLDRVKARMSKPAAERLKEVIADFDPRTPASDQAVAAMVMRAARSRCDGLYCPVDNIELREDRAPASAKPMLVMAASMSIHYDEADVEWLRGALFAQHVDIPLSTDREEEGTMSFT